ncbi:MAG: hypothetical protein RL497_2660 [Pseudomonadota bacterium]|jgi:hypothetical protein
MKIGSRVIFFVVIIYCIFYAALTKLGAYEDNVTTMSKIIAPCPCISDLEFWQPKYILYTQYDGRKYVNALGLIYEPLTILDQKFWHKTKEFHL